MLSDASVGDAVLRITVRANLRVFRKSSYQKTGLPDTPGSFGEVIPHLGVWSRIGLTQFSVNKLDRRSITVLKVRQDATPDLSIMLIIIDSKCLYLNLTYVGLCL